MNSNLLRRSLIAIATLIILIGIFSSGFVAGRVYKPKWESSFLIFPGSQTAEPVGSTTPEELEILFVPFWQAWKLVHEQYMDQPVDDVMLMRGAIQGMVKALGDENSSYIDPEQLKLFNAQISGEEYEGIGAWVDTTREYLTIIAPMLDSPAEKAGLKPGDQIIAIDGVDMTGIDGELVRQKVIGPAGLKIILTIKRPGLDNPFDVEITRSSIKSSNVIGRMLDEDIAYVQLLSFGDDKTLKDLRLILDRLLNQKPAGLILDLRNNGGGLLDSAINVTSEFIDSGIIAYEEYGDGRKVEFTAKKGGRATKIPLVVLINEGSASASEILAGAVQDLGRGTIIGAVSYGKGSIQVWTQLANDQGAIRVSVARWNTPNGRTIEGSGLTPDIIVEITEEDIQSGKDVQLEEAINLLLGEE